MSELDTRIHTKYIDLPKFDAVTAIKPIGFKTKIKDVKYKLVYEKRTGSWMIFNNMFPHRIRRQLLAQGRNYLICCTGRPRTGKSYSMITLAKRIEPEFDIKHQVVFTAQEFMTLLKSDKLKDGSVIIWDEAGVGLSAKNWQSQMNKIIHLILQTFGYKHLCLIFTVPHFSFVDASTRRLINCHIHLNKRDMVHKVVRGRIHDITPAQIGKNIDIKRIVPRIKLDGRIFANYIIEFKKPNAKDCHAYEIKKREFTSNLEKQTTEDIRVMEESKKPKDKRLLLLGDSDTT